MNQTSSELDYEDPEGKPRWNMMDEWAVPKNPEQIFWWFLNNMQ